MKPLTKEWIKKAEEDYRVAVREAKARPGNYSAVCFHSQQAIEKYLKAVLQENKISFAKIHDLEILLKGCVKTIPALRDYREELIWLTAFGVEVRYPGFEVGRKDMEKAVKFIRRLRIIFKSYFAFMPGIKTPSGVKALRRY